MYKIHSKLVFLKKINTSKQKIHAVQVNSARELHCSLFLTWTVHHFALLMLIALFIEQCN